MMLTSLFKSAVEAACEVFFRVVLVVVTIDEVRWSLAFLGGILCGFHHWIAGGILILVALVGYTVNKNLEI